MIYLSLGTNLGDKVENLNKAIQLLEEKLSVKLIKSTVLETEPVGFKSNDNFLNQVVSMEDCDYSPEELLDICQGIEVEMGRTPHSIQFNKDGSRAYSSRVIDIDILLYHNLRIDTERLQIPHPQMFKRDFVMIPLREIISERELLEAQNCF